jgi:hypothetical protein
MHGIAMQQENTPISIDFSEPHRLAALDFFTDLGISCVLAGDDSKVKLSKRSETPIGIEKLTTLHANSLLKKSEKIIELARVNRWQFPMPEILTPTPKILIWQRNSMYKPKRNSPISLIEQLAKSASAHDARPIVVGHKHGFKDCIEIGNFWEHDFFKSGHNLAKQLWFQHKLFTDCGVKASLGMMSGVMDGAAMFFGHKTIFFARGKDAKPRMSRVASAVPGLYWLETNFDKYLTTLNETQLNTLESLIWPIS